MGLNTKIISRVAGAGLVATALFTGGFEGWSNPVYKDSAGVLTACAGHARTGPDGKPLRLGQTFSDDVCSYLLGQDIAAADATVTRLVHVPLSQGERMAYDDFVLNLGSGTFARSSVRAKLNAGDRAGACGALLLYDKAKVRGKLIVLRGLKTRRAAEMRACLS